MASSSPRCNEATVIRELLQSIKAQNYPDGLVTAFVVADNCTDNTAELAQMEGAVVYERFNQLKVGKGYALDYAFKHIMKEYPKDWFEAYFVFDADNLLDPNYIREMNKVFDSGYEIITSYRQLQELRFQLDFRRVFAVVFTRIKISEPGADDVRLQLCDLRHRLHDFQSDR